MAHAVSPAAPRKPAAKSKSRTDSSTGRALTEITPVDDGSTPSRRAASSSDRSTSATLDKHPARYTGGRPTKRTPANRKQVLEALSRGATYRLAAASAGMGYSTLNEWMNEDEAFLLECRAAEAQRSLQALRQIEQAAAEGTWQAAAWYLERRHTEDYGRTIQQQVQSGEVQHKIVVEYVADWRARAGATTAPVIEAVAS